MTKTWNKNTWLPAKNDTSLTFNIYKSYQQSDKCQKHKK